MNYHIAICDDSTTDQEYISVLVADWAKASGNSVTIKAYSSAEAFLFHYADDKNFDILLLDIEMGGMDGVQLAKEVRRDNEAVQIVFITGYSDYVTEGYDVSALHYLMKPVHKEKLVDVLKRATQKIKKNGRVLHLELSGEMVRIPFYEIRYLEVRQNYVTIHAKQDYTVKKTLGEFEAEFDDRFYRAGRSFLVNLTYIQRVTKTEVYLSDGTGIPLPRGQYEPLNRAIISHN
ncbi:LytR/AlgR family response regulator transcription factor [Gorillibacterium timonense]|uniref:LytR/AlgR family response regulator transcription factor n=1 Tax=Gorillibacterium timonense TaxID=1689269 RepID=UPI00071CED95|nr:response regulator transcription factor [Gorillibacterium timonense]